MRPIPAGLSDDQIDDLQNFLDTIPNAMHFEHVDGFFCALVCGPDPVPSSEYLPYVFGGQMPSFSAADEASEVIGALAKHWDHIDETLAGETTYYPFLYADMEGKCAANDWADAFLLGIQLRRDGWSELLGDKSETALLKEILALRDELSHIMAGQEATIPSDERETLVKQLVMNVQKIYEDFAPQRAKNMPSSAL